MISKRFLELLNRARRYRRAPLQPTLSERAEQVAVQMQPLPKWDRIPPAWINDPVVGAICYPFDHRIWETWRRDQARADWTNVDQRLRNLFAAVVQTCAERGLPLYVHTAYRTPEVQAQKLAAGLSQLAEGPHQRGVAVDLVHSGKGWDLTRDQWKFIHWIVKEVHESHKGAGIQLRWGGDFKTLYDPAHYELHPWRTVPKVSGF
jgi:hypothetical protein